MIPKSVKSDLEGLYQVIHVSSYSFSSDETSNTELL